MGASMFRNVSAEVAETVTKNSFGRCVYADTRGRVSLRIFLTISSCDLGYIWLQNTRRFGCNRSRLFCSVFCLAFPYLSP